MSRLHPAAMAILSIVISRTRLIQEQSLCRMSTNQSLTSQQMIAKGTYQEVRGKVELSVPAFVLPLVPIGW
jgi:hypothetical protein